jgi:hypothetical protein
MIEELLYQINLPKSAFTHSYNVWETVFSSHKYQVTNIFSKATKVLSEK